MVDMITSMRPCWSAVRVAPFSEYTFTSYGFLPALAHTPFWAVRVVSKVVPAPVPTVRPQSWVRSVTGALRAVSPLRTAKPGRR
ncbi:hypothetical protein SFUMM280S_11208 [Streptomyces fumanus]